MVNFKSRETLFSFFEDYSGNRREEITESKTSKPLLKTYIIETYRSQYEEKETSKHFFEDIPELNLSTQVDDSLYTVSFSKSSGFLEKVNNRFWLLYSIDRSSELDMAVEKLVRHSSILDHLWISGKLFNVFWDTLLSGHDTHRFIRMSFEFDDLFYPRTKRKQSLSQEEDDVFEEFEDKRVSRFGLTEQKEVMNNILPQLQNLLPSFYVTSLLRFPSSLGSGGHDFYYSGKITNRSDSFKDHRLQALTVCNVYEKITQTIEDEVWFGVEKNTLKIDNQYYNLKGTPVTILFDNPLSDEKFENFVHLTFDKKCGPFRLWGQPIRLGSRLVHVYGVDMHLWQEVYLEMTPKQFILILPEGTCGNTIHRIVTNIQRYLEPKITVSIGNQDYDKLSSRIARGMNLDDLDD